MIRARLAASVAVIAVTVSACSSEPASGSGSPCEDAFAALCDKAATCGTSGKVAFVSATGDGGSGATLSFGSAADCKTLYGAGCASKAPADVPACKSAAGAAECKPQGNGTSALVFPTACETR